MAELITNDNWNLITVGDLNSYPPVGVPVTCKLRWPSGNFVYSQLVHVYESDVVWRIFEGMQELDYSLDVVGWKTEESGVAVNQKQLEEGVLAEFDLEDEKGNPYKIKARTEDEVQAVVFISRQIADHLKLKQYVAELISEGVIK